MKPMLAAKAALVEPPTGPGWLFERKFDGVRALAGRRAGQPFIMSREGADITHAFPEVLPLLSDTEGITGFMYGAAVSMLSKVWRHGDALRRWHNISTQIGTEGEEANAKGGTLNPALLVVR